MDARYMPAPRWKELYQAALFETDTHQLLARIKEAERAILDRAQELLVAEESSEGRELSAALNAIRDLRRMYQVGDD
jgi:hypothetical protein